MSDRPAILQFGAAGQVAREALNVAEAARVEIIALGRAEADLRDPDAVRAAVRGAPDNVVAVLNAAAYTDVDAAETDEDTAFAVNAEAPGVMAEECDARGLAMVHLSTDYVFDGEKDAPYLEFDPPAPLGAYGRTKLAGEEAVLSGLLGAVVLRTSWVFSPYGRNFVKTMARLAGKERLTIVNDQRGCPTPARAIAETAIAIAKARAARPGEAPAGVFNFAGDRPVTWKEFADDIFARMREAGHRTPEVVGIPSADYPTPARRPKNSVLDCSKIRTAYGVAPAAWQGALNRDLPIILDAL